MQICNYNLNKRARHAKYNYFVGQEVGVSRTAPTVEREYWIPNQVWNDRKE